MAESYREHVCPNCGAPLGIPHSHERYFKCQFCGTVLEDHASTEEQATGVFKIKISQESIDSARLPVYTAPPVPERSSRPGCAIAAGVAILVGSILAFTLVPALLGGGAVAVAVKEAAGGGEGLNPFTGPAEDDSGLGDLEIYGFANGSLLPSDDDTTPDFAGAARGPDDTTYMLYLDLDRKPGLRWSAALSGDKADYLYNAFQADATRLYYNFGTQTLAFNREKGALIWEAQLPDSIQYPICSGCFQLFGDSLVTLTSDGTLGALDAATGETRWEVRLNETPRQVVPFGGNPGVLDEVDGEIRFLVFDLESGEQVYFAVPVCPNTPFPDDPQEMGIYDPMLPSPDGSAVTFFGGFFDPACAQRWEPGGDGPAWLATYSAENAIGIEMENLLQGEDGLYIVYRHGVHTIDTASGEFTTLFTDEDYDFLPLGEQDGVLVLLAERTRGTRRWEIWGVDAELGNVKWTYIPESGERFDDRFGTLSAGGAWTASMSSYGVRVAQMYGEPSRIVFQTIPLQSGTASAPATFTFPSADTLWVTVLGWWGDDFWVLGGSSLLVVDPGTGETIASWN